MAETRLERALSLGRRLFSRLGFRLVAVNVVVVCVPLFGVEFARLYERRLLDALERDMDHQAVMLAELVRLDVARGISIDDASHQAWMERVARMTHAQLRLLDRDGMLVADSHRGASAEGAEPRSPSSRASIEYSADYAHWPEVAQRSEVRHALAGLGPASYTRVSPRAPGVLLFHARPVTIDGAVAAVVYVTRSTTPVMRDLHLLRRGLSELLAITLAITIAVTLLLALSITRPLARLAKSATRIAHGEKGVAIDRDQSGEIGELAEAIATMTEHLDARLVHSRDFAADVAHELKSPLTSIRGAAELLEEGAAEDVVARARFLRNIRLDVERLDRIVSRLLELGRVEAGGEARQPVDLAALVDDVADRAASADVSVVTTALVRPLVLIGPRDIDAALTNVIENAVRFAPLGSAVTVTLREERDELVIDVHDSGPGIPIEDRARVFDRFFTTDAQRDGTGLGLSIARSAMVAHGGILNVESVPGSTTFRFKFPGRLRVGSRG